MQLHQCVFLTLCSGVVPRSHICGSVLAYIIRYYRYMMILCLCVLQRWRKERAQYYIVLVQQVHDAGRTLAVSTFENRPCCRCWVNVARECFSSFLDRRCPVPWQQYYLILSRDVFVFPPSVVHASTAHSCSMIAIVPILVCTDSVCLSVRDNRTHTLLFAPSHISYYNIMV